MDNTSDTEKLIRNGDFDGKELRKSHSQPREALPQFKRIATSPWTISIVLLILTSISLWTISPTLIVHPPSSSIDNIDKSPCGNTTTQARAAGCHFDPMSFNWLPAACFDSDLVSGFLALDDWQWYSDETNSSAVPFDNVQTGEHKEMWVTRKFHLFHCTYQWRKLHRAILKGTPVDDYVGRYEHTEHCEHVLTENVPQENYDVVNVKIIRKFVGCGVVGQKELYKGQ